MSLSRKKILVISNTDFYGGGESFVTNTLSKVRAQMYYLVMSEQLKNNLPPDRGELFSGTGKWQQLKQIRGKIKVIKPDIIIFNGGSTLFFVPFVKAKYKVIYKHTTNRANGDNPIKRFVYTVLQQLTFLFAAKVIHVSKYSLNEQVIRKDKAIFIHHGIVPVEYTPKFISSPIKFLFIGRADKSKGLDIIVDVFSEIDPDQAQLHIVGAGEMTDYLNGLSKPNITYHGFSTDVNQYYKQCDVFISMPLFEAFGLTLIEAMNYGLPVISCYTGAVGEIVHNNVDGFIIDRDKISLRNVVATIISENRKIIMMSEVANQNIINNFTLEKTLDQIEQTLNKL